MADPTGREPPDAAPEDEAGDERERDAPEDEESDDRVPGDWKDVKRYLLGLLALLLLGILLMAVVAVYEYRQYAGAKAEDTRMIPAKQDVMRQGALPERLRKVPGMQKGQPSAAPSARPR